MKPKAYCKIQVVTDEYRRIVYKFKLIQLPKKSADFVGNGCLINVTNGSHFSPSGIHYLNSIDVRWSDLNCFVKYCLDYISGISQSFKRITIIKKKVNVNCKMECVK